jgi:hypothetical protein
MSGIRAIRLDKVKYGEAMLPYESFYPHSGYERFSKVQEGLESGLLWHPMLAKIQDSDRASPSNLHRLEMNLEVKASLNAREWITR